MSIQTIKILPFQFSDRTVRVVMRDNDPYFVAKDVCQCLCLDDVRRAVERLDEDERSLTPLVDSRGKKQEMWAVSESGLYSLILRSDKPEAKKFRKWVTSEVLPSIRKTGSYNRPLSRREELERALAQEIQMEKARGLIEIIAPDPDKPYGSIAPNGRPRENVRRAAFVAQPTSRHTALQVLEHLAQLELGLALTGAEAQ